ncbi:3-oxoacyl-[acyl-carrier-protein] reductase [bacterium]|nr:3-oxoacyl-[acyl-carrier-protein] reductase [bacterium]
MELSGKVAIVTGAARGIGAAITNSLCENGAMVVMVDVDKEALEQRANLVNQKNGSAKPIVCDITDQTVVNEMVKGVVSENGKIDILVNNAGITKDDLIIRADIEDWEKVLAVNLTGTFSITKAVVKYMMKQRSGKIINISSVVGLTGNPGQVSYSTSKAGLIGFTKSLAREVAKRGICVNAVAPGFIETMMTEGLSDEVKAHFLGGIPMNRPGKPEDVAGVVLFLASSQSDYITGEVIRVDGGMAM